MNIKKIFSGKIDLNPTYHGWPTVNISDSGELFVTCSGNRVGHVCPFGRVFLYRSTDFGRTWSGPDQLSNGPLDDRDAGINFAADGSLLVNYFTSILAFQPGHCRPEWQEIAKTITPDVIAAEHGFWMRRSTDGGKTWSEKYRTPVYNVFGPIRLKDGRLFFPGIVSSHMTAHVSVDPDPEQNLASAVSNDHGQTWQILAPIPAPAGYDARKCHEFHAVEAPDGRIIVQHRDHNDPKLPGCTWQTESADGGLTWSEPHKICNGFPSHLLRFGKDKLLMSYGWRYEPYGIRAMISEDSGRTWGEEIILYDKGLSGDLGYPSTVELPDGTLFTLWYENNGKIAELNYCNWTME